MLLVEALKARSKYSRDNRIETETKIILKKIAEEERKLTSDLEQDTVPLLPGLSEPDLFRQDTSTMERVICAERIGLDLANVGQQWSLDETRLQTYRDLYIKFGKLEAKVLKEKLLFCRNYETDGSSGININKPVFAQMIAHILQTRGEYFGLKN